MIESIELVNWKTHKSTTLRFQKGVNVLIGVMGSGKSSVMDALSFGLFGTFPALTHKRTSSKDLISSRPTKEDSAEVKLTFTVGQDRYTISRKVSSKESTASKIEKNGQYLQTQTERVNEEIASVLKVDYDTFSRAIYSEQNMMDYFLELAKGERKKQMDQMLGLDTFAKAEENATSLVNSIRSTIKDGEQTLSQLDVSQYKKELEKLTAERTSLESEIKALAEKAKVLKEDSTKIESKLVQARKAEKARELLSKELEGMKSKQEMLEREIKKIAESNETAEKLDAELKERKVIYEKLLKEGKEIREKETSSTKTIAGAEAEARIKGEKVAELEKLKAELEKRTPEKAEAILKELQEELDIATKDAAISEGRRSEALKAVIELEKHISKCPICERELDAAMKETLVNQKTEILSKSEKEIASLKTKTADLKEKIKKSRAEFEKVSADSKRLEEYTSLKASVAELKETVKKEREQHTAIAVQAEANSTAAEKLSKEINALSTVIESIKRREGYAKESKTIAEGILLKSKELSTFGDISKEMEELNKSFLAASNALTDSESKVESGSKYLKSIDSQIDEKAKSMARVAAIEEHLSKMRWHVSNLNKFKGALIETESSLRSRLVHSINSLMHEIWVQIYPYGDYTGIKLNAGKDDYSLEVATTSISGVEWNDLNGMASGGERSMACLAMRIALSMVIVPNLRWLILDEPTHNIDENGIRKLVSVLGETLPGIVEQIFIITHDSALKNISGARIYQLDRDKAKNEHTSYAEL